MATKKKRPLKKKALPQKASPTPWDSKRLTRELGKAAAVALSARLVWLVPGRVASLSEGGLAIHAELARLIEELTDADPELQGDEVTDGPELIAESFARQKKKLPANIAAWLALAPRGNEAMGRWMMAGVMEGFAKLADGSKPPKREVSLGITTFSEGQSGYYPFATLVVATLDGDWLAVFVQEDGSGLDDEDVPRLVGFIQEENLLGNLTVLLAGRADLFTGFDTEASVFAGSEGVRLAMRWVDKDAGSAEVAFLKDAPPSFWDKVEDIYEDAKENAEEWSEESDEPVLNEEALDAEFMALLPKGSRTQAKKKKKKKR